LPLARYKSPYSVTLLQYHEAAGFTFGFLDLADGALPEWTGAYRPWSRLKQSGYLMSIKARASTLQKVLNAPVADSECGFRRTEDLLGAPPSLISYASNFRAPGPPAPFDVYQRLTARGR
jgi:hypothetical protein